VPAVQAPLLKARGAARSQKGGFAIQDRDIVGITESVVARAQGNYASVDAIAADLRGKFGGEAFGIVFPILSRNRFAILLKAMARSTRHLIIQFSFPSGWVPGRSPGCEAGCMVRRATVAGRRVTRHNALFPCTRA